MNTARKMKRNAERRKTAASRLTSRPERRARPALLAETRAREQAEAQEHREWVASLTPEQRERYERRLEDRRQRQMQTLAPLLLAAMGGVSA